MASFWPVASSLTTAKGVTSEPVPEVVGMQTMTAFRPPRGKEATRFLMSWKRRARSSTFMSGTS